MCEGKCFVGVVGEGEYVYYYVFVVFVWVVGNG